MTRRISVDRHGCNALLKVCNCIGFILEFSEAIEGQVVGAIGSCARAQTCQRVRVTKRGGYEIQKKEGGTSYKKESTSY